MRISDGSSDVGSSDLLDGQARGRLAVVITVDGIALCAERDARHVGQPYLRAVGVHFHQDSAEFFRSLQARRADDGGIELLATHCRQADRKSTRLNSSP